MADPQPQVIDVPEPTQDDGGAVVERRVKVQMVPLQAVHEERANAARAKAEAEALRQRLAELEPDATRWREHSAAQLAQMTERNAADLAALPEAARAPIAAITDPAAQRALLDAIKAASAASAASPEAAQPPPAYPAGGAVQQAPTGGVELTAAERAWVERDRPDLRNIDPQIIKRHFQRATGGAKPS